MSLTPALWDIKQEIEAYARGYGLDFFETVFELVDYNTMNEIAAFGGFPTRYNHWRFGMEYEQLSKSYEYGLSKIYEMVINNNPAYAYLLEGNNFVDQKTVIAHVFGHVDFFKNNFYFSHTNRKMVDEMANHATRVRRYIDRFGLDKVEDFIETCLSLDNLIDFHAPYITRPSAQREDDEPLELNEMGIPKLPTTRDYMDNYINPTEYLDRQRKKMEVERAKKRRVPENPQKDVLKFLLDNAPLERWEADVLSMTREEAYYFAPQAQTKIMNEGWACVARDTYVFSSAGLVTMGALIEERVEAVSDGERAREVYDRHVIAQHPTVRVTTRRGLALTGSDNHRVMRADGQWARLDALRIGDQVRVEGGAGLWPQAEVSVKWPAAACNAAATLPPSLNKEVAALLGRLASDSLIDTPHPDKRASAAALWSLLTSPTQGPALLAALGAARADAQPKRIPDLILRSPAHVVRACLRALFDCDGDVSARGVTLRTSSALLSEQVQLLLMNDGVLCARERQADGAWLVQITGASARRFAAQVGFGCSTQQRALQLYLAQHADLTSLNDEPWADEVTALTHGREDVYDISVRDTHRYAASGLINHNSYWHSKILTEKALKSSEIIDYAEAMSGVLATSQGQLNPYKLGIELLRDIEERWNRGQFGKEYEECDDLEARSSWNRQLGLGRQKLFQVRSIYNDITFIDEFLTEDFCHRHKLFTFSFNQKAGDYQIASRDFKAVKQKLLFQLTNFGQPFIYVKDANFKNRAELLLHHKFDGLPLRVDYARDVLVNLYRVWKRPVNIETRVDNKGRLLTFDGTEHREQTIDYEPI
jgi:stage V sporulation protein R